MIKTSTFSSPHLLSQHNNSIFCRYSGYSVYFGSEEFYFQVLESHIILKNKSVSQKGSRKIPGLDLQSL